MSEPDNLMARSAETFRVAFLDENNDQTAVSGGKMIGVVDGVAYIGNCDLRFPTGHSIPGALLDL